MKRQCEKDIYIEKDKARVEGGRLVINLSREMKNGETMDVIISDPEAGYLTYYIKIIRIDNAEYDENGNILDIIPSFETIDFLSTNNLRDQGNGLIVKCTVSFNGINTKELFLDPVPTSGGSATARFESMEHCRIAFVYDDTGLSSFYGYAV